MFCHTSVKFSLLRFIVLLTFFYFLLQHRSFTVKCNTVVVIHVVVAAVVKVSAVAQWYGVGLLS